MAQSQLPVVRTKTIEERHEVMVFISEVVQQPCYQQTGKTHRLSALCIETDYQLDSVMPAYLLDFRLVNEVRAVFHNATDYELHEIESRYNEHAPRQYTVRQQAGGRNRCTLNQDTLNGILNKHSLSRTNYQAHRMTSQFTRKGESKSAFSQRGSILPLILSTLRNPEKTINQSKHRMVMERLFNTEIGHTKTGCCYIVRVVVRRISGSKHWSVVTAYPVQEHHVEQS